MDKMFNILDVGSGGLPKGTVNCDLFLGYTPHTVVKVVKAENFVKCDGHFLPFKDNSFNIVHSSHLIEHLTFPYLALQEFFRVAKRIVYIKVPYALCLAYQRKEHLFAFDKSTLENILSCFSNNIEIYVHSLEERFKGKKLDKIKPFKKFINWLAKLFLYWEIIAICQKKKK